MNKRLLVVPQRTSQTPADAHVGLPTMYVSRKTLIEISCVFTWDKSYCEQLKEEWKFQGFKVKLDGPAFDNPGGSFQPGRYIKQGFIHTSRGCPKQCPFCWVPKREGKIRQYKIHAGNVVQDNNLLACNRDHVEAVFQMLRKQRTIRFSGGLDCALITDEIVNELQSLRIDEIWIAYDNKRNQKNVRRSIRKLKDAGFSRDKVRCYVLAGYKEPIQTSKERLISAYEWGALPYVQVYQSDSDEKKMAGAESREDNLFVRNWSRPAIMRARMKNDF